MIGSLYGEGLYGEGLYGGEVETPVPVTPRRPWPTVTCEIAFTTDPGSTTPAWTDVTAWLRSGTVQRGRQSELDRAEAGTGQLVLDNSDRRFEPEYQASPYYPNVIPMRRLRIRALYPDPGGLTYDLFNGYVEDWPLEWDVRTGNANVNLIDPFEPLNINKLQHYFPVAQSGTRIRDLLDQAGWPDTGLMSGPYRSIAAGQSELQEITLDGDEALSAIQDTADSELGIVFVDGPGRVVFQDRTSRQGGASLATYSDNPQPASTNLLPNGDFEIDISGWEANDVGQASLTTFRDSTVSVHGLYSLRLDNDAGGEDDYMAATVTLPAPGWYTISGWVNIPDFQEIALFGRGLYVVDQVSGADWNDPLPGRTGGLPGSEHDYGTGPYGVGPYGGGPGQATSEGWEKLWLIVETDSTSLEVRLYAPHGRVFWDAIQVEAGMRATEFIPTNGSPASRQRDYLYLAVAPSYGVDRILNDVRITPVGGETPHVFPVTPPEDPSQKKYLVRTVDRQPLLTTGADADAQAQFLYQTYKEPVLRFDEMVIEPFRDDGWDRALAMEIGQRLVVEKQPPGGGALLARDVLVERVQHDFAPKTWQTTVSLSPASAVQPWVLDSPTRSQLDFTTILGY